MARFSLAFLAVFFVSGVHGQEPGPARRLEPRYVPIPFQGNFEDLFKKRLQTAQEIEPLRNLLSQIQKDPKKFQLDPGLLKMIDLENPALRQMLREMVEKH